jgi:hypothetical protein
MGIQTRTLREVGIPEATIASLRRAQYLQMLGEIRQYLALVQLEFAHYQSKEPSAVALATIYHNCLGCSLETRNGFAARPVLYLNPFVTVAFVLANCIAALLADVQVHGGTSAVGVSRWAATHLWAAGAARPWLEKLADIVGVGCFDSHAITRTFQTVLEAH